MVFNLVHFILRTKGVWLRCQALTKSIIQSSIHKQTYYLISQDGLRRSAKVPRYCPTSSKLQEWFDKSTIRLREHHSTKCSKEINQASPTILLFDLPHMNKKDRPMLALTWSLRGTWPNLLRHEVVMKFKVRLGIVGVHEGSAKARSDHEVHDPTKCTHMSKKMLLPYLSKLFTRSP